MWPFRSKVQQNLGPKRCSAMSGSLWGYQCGREEGHPLPHAAEFETSADELGRVVGRKTVRWPVTEEIMNGAPD